MPYAPVTAPAIEDSSWTVATAYTSQSWRLSGQLFQAQGDGGHGRAVVH